MTKIAKSLADIVSIVNDPYINKDGEEVNRHKYAVTTLLGSICFTAKKELYGYGSYMGFDHKIKVAHDEAVALAKDIREDDCSPGAAKQLDYKLSWLETLTEQECFWTAILEAAGPMYFQAAGEEHKMPKVGQVPTKTDSKFINDVLDRAKRSGIDMEFIRGGGVEVAAEENA